MKSGQAKAGELVVNNQKAQWMSHRQSGASLPLEDYDSLSVQEIVNRSMELSPMQIDELYHYEITNKNRKNLLRHFKNRIGALAATWGTGRADPPPGEERPEKRKESTSQPFAREDPPPGEERPNRRVL
jgi:hypothetical protein